MSRVALPAALVALVVALAACNQQGSLGETPGGSTGCLTASQPVYQSPDGPTPSTATYPIPSIRITFSKPVSIATINSQNIHLYDAGGNLVPISTNGANFPNSAEVTPRQTLANDATYRLELTSGLATTDGCALATTSFKFTVRHEPLPAGAFEQHDLGITVRNPTAMAFGPDGRLYVAELQGTIHAVTLGGSGSTKTATSVQEVTALNGRAVTGMLVRRNPSTSAIEIWASNADLNQNPGATNPSTDPYGGRVTRLSGPTFSSKLDVITGIPRSAELHQVNGIAFGPDGRLYIDVGGMTNYGAPSANFGNRPEKLMSAAMLVADVGSILSSPAQTIDVQPAVEGGSYPVDATNLLDTQGGTTPELPVKVYATGMRNPYGIVWTKAGQLYATDNGGNPDYGLTPGPDDGCPGYTPAAPGTTPDKINLVQAGHWYGQPNPARGECALNTSQTTPIPRTFTPPAAITGENTSSDGITEYVGPDHATGVKPGDLLYVNYASTKALNVYHPGTNSTGVIEQPFDNPLAVAVDPSDGTIFVGEFGNNPVSPEKGNPRVSYLTPRLP